MEYTDRWAAERAKKKRQPPVSRDVPTDAGKTGAGTPLPAGVCRLMQAIRDIVPLDDYWFAEWFGYWIERSGK